MAPGRAVFDAIDLAAMPKLVAMARSRPLPDGVADVIRIVAGCEATLAAATAATGRDAATVRTAAEFYIQQVLLFAGADRHRILGARPGDPRADVRRNMRFLLLWLHPDRAGEDWRAAFATRVIAAWRELDAPTAAPRAAPPRRRLARARRRPDAATAHTPRNARRWRGAALLLASLLLVAAVAWFDPELGLTIP